LLGEHPLQFVAVERRRSQVIASTSPKTACPAAAASLIEIRQNGVLTTHTDDAEKLKG
jgi:hypothetical protein